MDKFTISGGWQISHQTNPSDLPIGTATRYFNGGFEAQYGTAVQGANNFPNARNLQVAWIGGKWAVLPTVDIGFGYYHAWQNDYLGATETFGGARASCAPNTGVNPAGGTLKGTNSSKCAGSEDAISGLIDWKAYKRLDVYAGVMYSKARDGMASGWFADNNLATTAGIRFSF